MTKPLDLDALRAGAELEAIDFAQAHTDAQHLKNYSQSGFLPPPTLLARAGELLEALTTVADPPTILTILNRLTAAEADAVRLREVEKALCAMDVHVCDYTAAAGCPACCANAVLEPPHAD